MRWLSLIILLISTSLNALDISSQTAETVDSLINGTIPETLHYRNKKSPTTVFILSLVGGATILPGLGQHYNGEPNKGLRMGAVWFTGWIIAAGTVSRDNEKTGQAIGNPLVLSAWVWSCIDAPLLANKINERQEKKNTCGHMLEFHKKQHTFGIDFNVNKKTVGPKLTIHF